MKKILIVYIIMFTLTILIPAVVCFTKSIGADENDLATIFRQYISLIVYYH